MSDLERRQERAYRASLNYTDGNDTETNIVDLIADLLHLAESDYSGADDILERALMHYNAERTHA